MAEGVSHAQLRALQPCNRTDSCLPNCCPCQAHLVSSKVDVTRVHDHIIICVADTLAEQLAGCVACGSTQQQMEAAAACVTRAWLAKPTAPLRQTVPTYHRRSAQSPCWRPAATDWAVARKQAQTAARGATAQAEQTAENREEECNLAVSL